MRTTSAPRVSRLTPDTLVVGTTMTVEGEQFPSDLVSVRVRIAGTTLEVRAISSNRMEVQLPAVLPPCGPVRRETVIIEMQGLTSTHEVVLRRAARMTVDPADSSRLVAAEAARCLELPAMDGGAGRYEVAVLNTGTTLGESATFSLRGQGMGGLAGVASMDAAPSAARFVSAGQALVKGGAINSADDDRQHGVLLAQQRALLTGAGNAAARWAAAPKMASAMVKPAAVGDTVRMSAILGSCSAGRAVNARVVYAGARALVLEDVTAPRAGKMDVTYRQLGREFDEVVYPLLAESVGDPLAMNGAMGGDGRVTMLFTRFVNDSAPGTAGYVSACNFYPRATFAGSNQDEVFYARVATSWETPDEWRRAMRGTIVHEAKHLASFAERFARGASFEEPWLEEATARVAEELYARSFADGVQFRGQAGFAASVQCEVLQCDDRPLIMWKHFTALHQYLQGADSLSPFGAVRSGDYTYYASGWSLVRWVLDRYAGSESMSLKALVRGDMGSGIAALTTMTGVAPHQLAEGWQRWLRSAYDANSSTSRSASWNLPDIMRGLGTLFPEAYGASPSVARRTFGDLQISSTRLAAFGAYRFILVGAPSSGLGSGQLIELQTGADAASVAGVRLSVTRLN
ncbi:MAG TPA: IPT/TIG domain-containing protein [Gemmatimonas sp.]